MFPYPDTLHWRPPQSQLDAVGTGDRGLVLAGLGSLDPLGDPMHSRNAAWTWMTTSIGATVLVKHRLEPRPMLPGKWPAAGTRRSAPTDVVAPTLFDIEFPAPAPPEPASEANPLEELLASLAEHDVNDETIGRVIRRIAEAGTRDQVGMVLDQLWHALRTRHRPEN